MTIEHVLAVVVHHISAAGNELLHSLDPRDQVAIWIYAGAVKQAADYQKGRETLQALLAGLRRHPGASVTA